TVPDCISAHQRHCERSEKPPPLTNRNNILNLLLHQERQMTTTPLLEFPHILPSQAQKHVTHNESLEKLDVLVQTVALARVAAPPPGAGEGECWVVEGGSGSFLGHDGQIARFRDGGWDFQAARAGWRVWLEDEALLVVWNGSAWTPAV